MLTPVGLYHHESGLVLARLNLYCLSRVQVPPASRGLFVCNAMDESIWTGMRQAGKSTKD